MIHKWKILKSIVAAAAVLFLFSCTNDPEEVKKISVPDDQPLEIQENLKLQYSDSSFIKLELTAPLAENYPQLEEPKLVFPKGIVVRFFDAAGNENSRLRADYAINHTKKNLWFAEGDVVVVNKKGEQLNTEQLYWNEKKELIYTEEKVKITTADEIIWGEGFEADQNFSNYTISKVTGQITIDDE